MFRVWLSRRVLGEKSALRTFCVSAQFSFPRQDRLRPFITEKDILEKDPLSNPLLNPLDAKMLRKKRPEKVPEHAKTLKVNVVGIPNAGKSTLINSLVGSNICAHSNKVHTTRRNMLGVLTHKDTQIIFQDTPGIITKEEKQKFNLEDAMLEDPYDSCVNTDLIVVLHDVSNRFVREAISKRVLDLLIRNPTIPAILVLNKMDTVPHSKGMFDLIRKLTCAQLQGKKQLIHKNTGPDKKENVDAYFKSREKRQMNNKTDNEQETQSSLYQPKKIKIRSYNDLLRVIKSDTSGYDMDKLVEDLTIGLPGWPGFKDVFTISALKGNGVEDLKDYLLYNAKPGNWQYNEKVETTEDPRTMVVNIAKSKLLDVLKFDVPYGLQPTIQSWNVENGVLRILFQIDSNSPRTTSLLLYHKASNLKRISELIERDLQNLFHCEVFVSVNINVTHKNNVNSPSGSSTAGPIEL